MSCGPYEKFCKMYAIKEVKHNQLHPPFLAGIMFHSTENTLERTRVYSSSRVCFVLYQRRVLYCTLYSIIMFLFVRNKWLFILIPEVNQFETIIYINISFILFCNIFNLIVSTIWRIEINIFRKS